MLGTNGETQHENITHLDVKRPDKAVLDCEPTLSELRSTDRATGPYM